MAVRITKYGQDTRPPCDVLLHYSFGSTEARKGDGARQGGTATELAKCRPERNLLRREDRHVGFQACTVEP